MHSLALVSSGTRDARSTPILQTDSINLQTNKVPLYGTFSLMQLLKLNFATNAKEICQVPAFSNITKDKGMKSGPLQTDFLETLLSTVSQVLIF